MNKWAKTPYANLRRYEASGTFFVNAKVRGRKLRRSLKTKSLEIAKEKLDTLLATERAKVPTNDEDWTFKELIDEYLSEIEANYLLKPRSKAYRVETVGMIRRTWPELDGMNPRRLTQQAVKDWSRKLVEKYAPSRFNGAVETMRAILRLGMARGIVGENLAMSIKRASVPLTPPNLPNSAQFKKLLKRLDAIRERKPAAQLVRLLAYTGMRVGAVPSVMRSNIDLERNEFILPKIKMQEAPVRIPMIGELRTLAKKLLKQHKGEGPLFEIANPRRALRTVCKELGIERLTPHDLRHIFATRCLESGVDVRTVAAWLCHRDGGALLLKRYAHLRNDHSHKMAKKVKF